MAFTNRFFKLFRAGTGLLSMSKFSVGYDFAESGHDDSIRLGYLRMLRITRSTSVLPRAPSNRLVRARHDDLFIPFDMSLPESF